MKKSMKVLLSIAAVTSLGWSTDISSWKPNYISNGDVWIHLEDKPNNAQDWVGIYPKGTNNDWSNVVDWRWAKNTSKTQVDLGDWYKFKLDDGAYEARFFLNNSFNVEEKVGFVVGDVPVEKKETIGARAVKSTALSKGKLFASPNGHGDCMSAQSACDIYTAVNKLSTTNNILFLDKGIYNLKNRIAFTPKSGTVNKPLIIESMDPNHKAVLVAKFDGTEIIKIYNSKYIEIRNLEIKNSRKFGIRIRRSSNIKIEGCNIHDNKGSGISLYDKTSNCIISDNKSYMNTDAEGNADGIQIENSSGNNNNKIIHNETHHNSDDGIDVFGGTNTTIKYNISYNNLAVDGKSGGYGNGAGIKACSSSSKGGIIEHNIAFNNAGNGFECNKNDGQGVIFKYNTAYHNGYKYKQYGFELSAYSNATLQHNISSNNAKSHVPYGNQSSNSWEISENINFMSIDIHTNNFLKPISNSDFENMGAYANQ